MDELETWIASLPPAWTEGCDPALLREARRCHDSPGRHYHTWEHVTDCVAKLALFEVESPRTAFLALVFHDAVYVPGDPDNEARSAELAARSIREHCAIPGDEVREIQRIILATRHHTVDEGEASGEMKVVLDIDMSILGASAERYERYASAVHAEFVPAAVSHAAFVAGRGAFLRKVLASPAIFLTPSGRARWEAPARVNLRRELGWLAP